MCMSRPLFTAVHTLSVKILLSLSRISTSFTDNKNSDSVNFYDTQYLPPVSDYWLLVPHPCKGHSGLFLHRYPFVPMLRALIKRPHPVKGRSLIRCTTCYIIRACVQIPRLLLCSYALCYGAGCCSLSVHGGQSLYLPDICSPVTEEIRQFYLMIICISDILPAAAGQLRN